jgi:dynein heavy chain, axonemal
MCTKQLERATELIGGLGGEGDRWADAAEKLGIVYETLTGKIELHIFIQISLKKIQFQAMF